MLDSLAANEPDNPKMLVKQELPKQLIPLNLRYDLTPKDNINMVTKNLPILWLIQIIRSSLNLVRCHRLLFQLL